MRLYNVLLGLYPASFRNEYGDEMRALFRRRRQQAGGAGIAVLWLTTAGEVIANAIGAHIDILTQDLSYVGRTQPLGNHDRAMAPARAADDRAGKAGRAGMAGREVLFLPAFPAPPATPALR
jgi:hypothetical protein